MAFGYAATPQRRTAGPACTISGTRLLRRIPQSVAEPGGHCSSGRREVPVCCGAARPAGGGRPGPPKGTADVKGEGRWLLPGAALSRGAGADDRGDDRLGVCNGPVRSSDHPRVRRHQCSWFYSRQCAARARCGCTKRGCRRRHANRDPAAASSPGQTAGHSTCDELRNGTGHYGRREGRHHMLVHKTPFVRFKEIRPPNQYRH